MGLCVFLDCGGLVFKRVLLVFGGHAKVLSNGNKQIGSHSALLREHIGRIEINFGEKRHFVAFSIFKHLRQVHLYSGTPGRTV